MKSSNATRWEVALLAFSVAFGVACGERDRLEKELGRIPGVSRVEVRDMNEEDFGAPEYVATLELANGGTLTISGVRAADLEASSALVVDEAAGWLPRCLVDDADGAILGIDVVQSTSSEFLPGRIRNLRDLVSRYQEIESALQSLPHDRASATAMVIDRGSVRCFAAPSR